jgi:hypothetical protein
MLLMIALVLAAPSPYSSGSTLSISPMRPIVGTNVVVTLDSDVQCNFCTVDFGDGSPEEPILSDEAVSHEYSSAGTFVVSLLVDGQRTLEAIDLTVDPAPNPHIDNVSLMWPDGSAALSLSNPAHVPAPTAYVRIDGPGTLQLLWLVDGTIVSSETMHVSQAGIYKDILSASLTASGSHKVEVRVLVSGAPTTHAPPPGASITYALGAAP